MTVSLINSQVHISKKACTEMTWHKNFIWNYKVHVKVMFRTLRRPNETIPENAIKNNEETTVSSKNYEFDIHLVCKKTQGNCKVIMVLKVSFPESNHNLSN